ncbi:unnamed protein product [Mytilus edulis]|uniref:Ig-like domain-containing protein n=1 Tax=Mytilus edulis TaxID=6550 RepID=A0A8S3V1K6_MYTED|nr:unnamed protein product [Mytilus edulis]
MQTTQNSVPSFREGDTVQFTCTGNIGKPPGRFVWQLIPEQGEPIVYYNETTVVVDKIPDICSFRGTSNLTVEITAEYFKAKVQCFEESQADVLGMFVETEPLYVSYTVRHINITKQPNQPQYDHKTPTITLTCTGDGNPKPTYKWFRQENRRNIISSTNLYIIEDVIQNNSGLYICEAYNTLEDVKYYANNSVQIEIGEMREQNCCQKLMDCSMSCYGRAVNPVTNSTIPLTELEAVSNDNKERENHSKSRNSEESRSQNVDDSFISCHDITFNPEYTPVIFINNTVKSGDLEDAFNVDNTITENKISSRSKYVLTLISMPVSIMKFK